MMALHSYHHLMCSGTVLTSLGTYICNMSSLDIVKVLYKCTLLTISHTHPYTHHTPPNVTHSHPHSSHPHTCSITILGTGAKWLSALEERSIHPLETHSLTTLHTILSTGSPLKPQSYDYVYSHIKTDLMLGSISGEGCEGSVMCVGKVRPN